MVYIEFFGKRVDKMAGIAAVLFDSKEKGNRAKELLSSISENISHRGKRKKFISEINGFKKGYACILSNYDLNRESLYGDDGSFTLIDGKIYNIDSLLREHDIIGHKKQTQDSYKFSLLFNKLGIKSFKLLEGSFALLYVDSKGNVFLARDFIGRKPLYYAVSQSDDLMLIGSEIKLFKDLGEYFEIKELMPGNYIKNDSEQIRFKALDLDANYIFLSDYEKLGNSVDCIDRLLNDSVKKRISKNNAYKYGVWLSGGLDSSVIAAVMKKFKEEIHTYSVGFNDSADILYSRKVAKHIVSRHYEYNFDINEIFNLIPEVIYTLESFDAPLVRSSIGNLIVSKISSESDIVFSGEGGDEVFAGYNYFLNIDSPDLIQTELLNAINSLHNTALQRVDRFANRYSIDVKYPFLDEQLISYSLMIPAELKIDKKKKATKNILRKVAEKYLPADIVWRTKDKFWEGSGIYDKLKIKIDSIISDKEFDKNSLLKNGFRLRNKEEYYYYKIFTGFFPDIDYSKLLSFTEDFN